MSSRRGKGWENLRERPTSSLATGGAGITSGSPGSEITDSGPTGSTGTAVSGGIMGGVVDGSFGVASLEGSGILDAKEDGRRRAEGSRRPVPVPVERKTAKALPRDADHDVYLVGQPHLAQDSFTQAKEHPAAAAAAAEAAGTYYSGAGGTTGTAQDYLQFAQMLLNGGTLEGKRILGRKTVEMMASDHLGAI